MEHGNNAPESPKADVKSSRHAAAVERLAKRKVRLSVVTNQPSPTAEATVANGDGVASSQRSSCVRLSRDDNLPPARQSSMETTSFFSSMPSLACERTESLQHWLQRQRSLDRPRRLTRASNASIAKSRASSTNPEMSLHAQLPRRRSSADASRLPTHDGDGLRHLSHASAHCEEAKEIASADEATATATTTPTDRPRHCAPSSATSSCLALPATAPAARTTGIKAPCGSAENPDCKEDAAGNSVTSSTAGGFLHESVRTSLDVSRSGPPPVIDLDEDRTGSSASSDEHWLDVPSMTSRRLSSTVMASMETASPPMAHQSSNFSFLGGMMHRSSTRMSMHGPLEQHSHHNSSAFRDRSESFTLRPSMSPRARTTRLTAEMLAGDMHSHSRNPSALNCALPHFVSVTEVDVSEHLASRSSHSNRECPSAAPPESDLTTSPQQVPRLLTKPPSGMESMDSRGDDVPVLLDSPEKRQLVPNSSVSSRANEVMYERILNYQLSRHTAHGSYKSNECASMATSPAASSTPTCVPGTPPLAARDSQSREPPAQSALLKRSSSKLTEAHFSSLGPICTKCGKPKRPSSGASGPSAGSPSTSSGGVTHARCRSAFTQRPPFGVLRMQRTPSGFCRLPQHASSTQRTSLPALDATLEECDMDETPASSAGAIALKRKCSARAERAHLARRTVRVLLVVTAALAACTRATNGEGLALIQDWTGHGIQKGIRRLAHERQSV